MRPAPLRERLATELPAAELVRRLVEDAPAKIAQLGQISGQDGGAA